MENENRTGLRRIIRPEQAEHLALKEYATVKLLQVVAERDAAILERNNALAERKAAFAERNSAFLQRDIAFAERNNAIMERDAAVAALELTRGHRNNNWNGQKRQSEFGKGRAAIQLTIPDLGCYRGEAVHPYTGEAAAMEAAGNRDTAEPFLKQSGDTQKKETSSTKLVKRKPKAAAKETPKRENKKKHLNEQNEGLQQAHIRHEVNIGQHLLHRQFQPSEHEPDKNMNEIPNIANRPIPYCSCTGTNQQCYKWGNGGWQSACCTTTLSLHPLPMNPNKRGYRLPGRKMSAGAFQKLLERLSSEGVDLSQPIDLKNYWSKHGTNRYVTIK